MSLDNDRMMQFIYLSNLRRDLMYVKYHMLGLKNLQPLIDEIEEKYNNTIKNTQTGEL